MKKIILQSILLLLCLTPFLIGLHGPFLLDDELNLFKAAKAQNTIASWYQAIFGNDSGALRRPISNFSFLLNFKFFGSEPFAFKLVNIILHGINGLLVFAFILRLLPLINDRNTNNSRVAMLASAIWIIHPIQVSTTLYVVQRMTQLSTLFMLVSLILALKFFASSSTNIRKGIYCLAFVAGTAFLGLMAKENAVLVPLLLLVVWLCLPQKMRSQASDGQKFFCRFGIFFPIALLAISTAFMLPEFIRGYQVREFTIGERLLTQPYILGHYLSCIFFPNINSMGLYLDDFAIRAPSLWSNWLGITAVFMAIISALYWRKQKPIIAFAVLWYFACHALESSVIPLELAFEHRNYLALIGPAILIALGLVSLSALIAKSLSRLVIGMFIATLFAATLSRAHQWSSIELFVRAEARHHPNSLRALNSVAALDYELGNSDAALNTIRKLETLYPNSFWVNALKLNIIVCGQSNDKPDYDKLLAVIKANPADRAIAASLLMPASNISKQKCTGMNNDEFDHFIGQAIAILEPANQKLSVERLFVLRAMLASTVPDKKRQEQMLIAGVNVNPDGTNARFDLAYYYLNEGDLANAQKITNQLRQIIQWGADKIRVDELQNFIETEKAAQSAANKE